MRLTYDISQKRKFWEAQIVLVAARQDREL